MPATATGLPITLDNQGCFVAWTHSTYGCLNIASLAMVFCSLCCHPAFTALGSLPPSRRPCIFIAYHDGFAQSLPSAFLDKASWTSLILSFFCKISAIQSLFALRPMTIKRYFYFPLLHIILPCHWKQRFMHNYSLYNFIYIKICKMVVLLPFNQPKFGKHQMFKYIFVPLSSAG